MKAAICLLVLSAVVAVQSNNLHIGTIYPGDRILTRSVFTHSGLVNGTWAYYGNSKVKITYIQASEWPHTQYANITIVSGGLNHSSVGFEARAANSDGFFYFIDIYGRD